MSITRTGNSDTAVVGWGRGMGHRGHMFLASSVITQANEMGADPYFFVSKTVGKDDPIMPEEKLAIYRKVFPKQAKMFQVATADMPDLNKVLAALAQVGYKNVVVVVGADQVNAFQFLVKPNKAGELVYKTLGLDNLKVISRQMTNDPSREEEGPRATPMREVLLNPDATEQEKFAVWREAMSPAISDEEVLDLMQKAESRMKSMKTAKMKEYITRIQPMIKEATTEQKARLVKLLSEAKKQLTESVAEGLAWSTLDEGMSMEDKMSVFEEFHTKGNLTESVDDDKKDYFVSLFNMSVSPIKGKKYIVVPLSLVGNRILPLDTPSIAEFIAQSNDALTFNTINGEKTYPSKTMRDLSIFNTFTFSSTGAYDKFRTALSLKFDISLPGIGKDKQQGVAEGFFDQFKRKPAEPEDPRMMQAFDAAGGYDKNIDVIGWQIGWKTCASDPSADPAHVFQKLYYGGGSPVPFDHKSFMMGFNACAKDRGVKNFGDIDSSKVNPGSMNYEEFKRQQGVAEGISDIIKGVKRKLAGKESPATVEKDYAVKARQGIDDANKYNNQIAYSDRDKAINRYKKVSKVVNKEGLNEFAPDGFNGGDDEGFSPDIAKMAQEDGFTKGVSLVDGATLERAMTINYWHSQHGGMYKQYFAKGFKQGRMNKINHDNKQYNLNLKLMKDGSIRHGEQGVAEDTELDSTLAYAQQHYPDSPNKQRAFMKFVQRSLKHGKEDDEHQDQEIEQLQADVEAIKQQLNVTESTDYLEEK